MRGARGLIGWSQSELAEASGLSLPTIKRMEKLGPGRSSGDNVQAVRVALERAGVIFIESNGEGAGVRLRKDRT
ncbi:helix-turn-helix domain-containing protein [Fulvimarina sp. 2208YS6-2-32]|uniref:helix-turn-helix domain-containing protein n=1 Tax=Fulvimarina uroteuthidis TaxID=3098149 RepID=UPI003A0FC542